MPDLFRCVVADPPWAYNDAGQVRVGTDHHYGTMTVKQICGLSVPVAAEAHLYLWTTNGFLREAFEVVEEAWGFSYKTTLTWAKLQRRNLFARPKVGMGHWFRGATEHVLFGVRGKLKLACPGAKTTLLLDSAESHSVKPDWFFKLVEQCSPGPRLEMFARRRRPGWSRWGNEVDSNVIIRSK